MFPRSFLMILLFCAASGVRGEVQVLMADHTYRGAALNCRYFFMARFWPMAGRESMDMDNRRKVMRVTRAQIYDTYRKLGTVPESEIASLMKEDSLFPARAVLYLRSVNDETGEVEGIMRVVTGDVGPDGYYNHHFSLKGGSKLKARVPVEAKYPDADFQEFLKREFPQRTELGRVVFGRGANEFRVLLDLVSVAVDLSYFPSSSKNHHLLVEAVRPAVHRYTELGLQEVKAPILFNDDRVLMSIPMTEAYDRHRGNVDRVVAEFDSLRRDDREGQRRVVAKMEAAIKKVSSNAALQRYYLYGIYRRAELYYAMDEFGPMVADVRHLIRFTPSSKDVKLFEVFAEAGNLYNWETHTGDPAKAIAYLDSTESVQRFADEHFPEATNRHVRLYVKGLVYLGSGNYAKARAIRMEMDAEDQRRTAERAAVGQRLETLPAEIYADRRLGGVKHRYYDPTSKEGDPQKALWVLEAEGSVSPMALTPCFHLYRAELLEALGRPDDAKKSRQIAAAL